MSAAPAPGPAEPAAEPGGMSRPDEKKEALDIYRQGYQAYAAHHYSESIGYFDRAINLDPACYQAYSYKGAALAFAGRYQQAMPLLDKAIMLNPHYEDAYFNKAISLELAGVYGQALIFYDQALEVNARDPWAYYGKASIYGRLRDVDACVKNLKQAIAIDPSTREHAKTEADFNNVRNAPAFQQLVYR
ncbi:TPR end-of-group domain-containing protein [Desulfotomaculum copahuensis]|uniref:TPR end-of-group domain-containing protein n=1 Tax=Desulfotomaculum copahuensis TaxID=1838280 RepID=UPI001372AE56|nr:tetratricopeptide repeat protein [Desulfotomaculum copahuensis]